MGTTSAKKFIKNVAGTLTEEAALLTTAGAADANKIPALNSEGVLDTSIVNGTATSSGAADASKVVILDGSGRLSSTMMPVGFGDDAVTITASEALSAGDLVNIWDNSGAKVRKADATTSGKEAHGFILSAVASGGLANVYFEGTNTAVTGQTPGPVFLSTTAGLTTSTAPSGTGNVVQRVGFAVSATAMNFQSIDPIVLA
jgi:hypothetical protein